MEEFEDSGSDDEDSVGSALSLQSIGAPVSYGLCMGACAGVATKKASKIAATVIGASFIALQVLQYKQYVVVDWKKIRRDTESVLSQKGDGKFGAEDLRILKKKSMSALQQGAFTGTGFAIGFAAGFKWA